MVGEGGSILERVRPRSRLDALGVGIENGSNTKLGDSMRTHLLESYVSASRPLDGLEEARAMCVF